MDLYFTVPTPPSTNALYRNVRGRGRVKTERYRTWLTAAGWAVKAAHRSAQAIAEPVSIGLQVPDDKRRDIDNFCKASLDLLVAQGVIADDKQIVRLVVEKVKRDDVLISLSVLVAA